MPIGRPDASTFAGQFEGFILSNAEIVGSYTRASGDVAKTTSQPAQLGSRLAGINR
jgi:hypothetical protein